MKIFGTFVIFCATCIFTQGQPDVQINIRSLMKDPRITLTDVADIKCAIEERCLDMKSDFEKEPEVRLLRFTLESCNIGDEDFRPTKPKSEWKFHTCHHHYHGVDVFSICKIFDEDGEKEVVRSQKASFCLQDTYCIEEKWEKYRHCNISQGITPGCCDIYSSKLDCQWIDITNLPMYKNYIFYLQINPNRSIPESNYENNCVQCNFYNRKYGRDERDQILQGCRPTKCRKLD